MLSEFAPCIIQEMGKFIKSTIYGEQVEEKKYFKNVTFYDARKNPPGDYSHSIKTCTKCYWPFGKYSGREVQNACEKNCRVFYTETFGAQI